MAIRNAETKASIVERFSAHFESSHVAIFHSPQNKRYLDVLPDLQSVHAYNHAYHRSIQRAAAKVRPSSVL